MTSIRPLVVLGLASLTFSSGLSAQAATIPIAQSPLFVAAQVPPLNMLVVGKDHKIYYEAYNDASDLNGDGALDIGYKPDSIDYFGYFNSRVCYLWDAGDNRFEPSVAAPNKTCSGAGQWSGDFLNYLTTSRMDALRRVLYGGWRQQDTATDTTLQGAFFPQDAHSWGKEYKSTARDGYDISQYAPLTQPAEGKYHLFAVTTVTDGAPPMFRVLENARFRVWNWLSIEGPVAGNNCFNAFNERVSCLSTWDLMPGAPVLSNVQITTWRHAAPARPNSTAEMDALFAANAVTASRCGSGPVASNRINATGNNNNPFSGTNGCTHNNYLTEITATLTVTEADTYQFAVDGNDAVDVSVNGTFVAGWYGAHGSNRSEANLNVRSGSITLSAGTHTIRFRHEDGAGDDGWGLFWRKASLSAPAARRDFAVRVQSCPSTPALRESTCKIYPSGVAKPTGILHDYGESERMMFGLLTGSQRNNLEGGVLRRNVLSFRSEIDANTGQFLPTVNGIVRNLDRLRMIGGGYAGTVTNNLNSDANWAWNRGTFQDCPSIGGRPINNRECRMWGNPVGEMVYEAMRYFAGATVPTTRFFDAPADSPGMLEEAAMGLSTETWRNPFGAIASNGLGYLSCAKPYQTIISDINPSYDGDLPGSAFSGTVTTVNDNPSEISGFDSAAQGRVIWDHQFGTGSEMVFIGEVAGGANDDAPTAKSADSLGRLRGLAPEEPGKLGTFNTATVARFARVTDINAAPGEQNISTFSVALASPLPRIEFPINGRLVTLLPFAKTVSGTFGGDPRKPTNTIVDFYVEQIVNLPRTPTNTTINGGRAYASFRINYEDVEQGNDHDMDAIVRYEVLQNADGTVTVRLDSEYAAGSADQNMGYIISGTTQDGIYLEVRDVGGPGTPYALNTPPGATAGQCAVAGALGRAPCNQPLQLQASRTFTPAAAASSAINLPDPLWFAAKFGGFNEGRGGNDLPGGANGSTENQDEWDADNNGVPDNYFLVTNPLQLRTQLSRAFDAIVAQNKPTNRPVTTGSRLNSGSRFFEVRYGVDAERRDWTGDIEAFEFNRDGTAQTARQWSAKERLANTAPGLRNLYATEVAGDNTTRVVKPFMALDFGTTRAEQLGALGLSEGEVDSRFSPTTTGAQMFEYLRGDGRLEQDQGGVFRNRSSLIGSIINAEAETSLKSDVFRWTGVPELRDDYLEFVTAKRANSSRPDVVFAASNNGILHAFNTASGDEVFGYIPASARVQLGEFAHPSYGHRYLLDGDLTAVDAKLGGSWATVLVGSTGRGGRSVFALDVTSPQSFGPSSVLWEVEGGSATGQDRDIGHVIGRAQVMYAEDEGWYAVFGNGINSVNSDPVLVVLNLRTGEVTTKLVANDDGDLTNGLINTALVDRDGNGRIDTVYGGDLQGNLWKFDLSGDDPATDWNVAFSGNPLFTAKDASGVPQPITGGIDVARGAGGLMVFFGTGRYLTTEDAGAGTNPQVQTLYGVRDNGTSSDGRRANLVQQTITGVTTTAPLTRTTTSNPVDYAIKRGWYLDLIVDGQTATGERFTGDPEVRGGVVFFPTFDTTGDICDPAPQNWMNGLDAISGGNALGGTRSVNGGTVCGAECGSVAGVAGAPIRSAVFTQQASVCRPGIDPGCSTVPQPPSGSGPPPPPPPAPPALTRCGEVERHTGAVFERACGRQSWRQVR